MHRNQQLKSTPKSLRFASVSKQHDSLSQMHEQLKQKIHELPASRLNLRARQIQSQLQEIPFLQNMLSDSDACNG